MPISLQHRRSANHTLRIACPNGHLGFAPIKPGSFRIGCDCEPDLICADSGSCDVGPVPLGADISSSPRQWQVDDLETMLLASRADDHEVVVVVQRTGADAETAARELSFAAERLYRRAIAQQCRTIDIRGASLSVLCS